jgi:hypothetical protein
LYNYFEFFEKTLKTVFKMFIKQKVYVLEIRHVFCRLIDDEEKFLSLDDELAIILRVLETV